MNLGTSMTQKQLRLGELSQQMMIAEMFPKLDVERRIIGPRGADRPARDREAERFQESSRRSRRSPANFNSDPAASDWAGHAHRSPGRARRAPFDRQSAGPESDRDDPRAVPEGVRGRQGAAVRLLKKMRERSRPTSRS